MSTIDTSFDDGNPTTGFGAFAANLVTYDLANPDGRVPNWCSAAM